ncbi:MAG TPA: GAF domain-containing sensor histidine kinase [Daejeonella sp.]|nr:GAF domain-containing sensor histidine kinase [Daejeonella sp.]
MNETVADIQADIELVTRIPIVSDLLDIVCQTTGMGFAAIARVTKERWVACAVEDKIQFGLLPGGELKLETTICNEIRQHGQVVAIDHVSEDEAYFNHHTPAMYGLQSYISVPIILKNGKFFGTLCAIDPNPSVVKTPQIMGMFKFYAELIAFHLHALEQSELSALQLKEERKTAELREQFIAILGHDLRNPVGAVANVAQLMLRMPLDDRMRRLAHIIQDSSYRMKELIENVMDFARGKLGDGIQLERKDEFLEDILSQVTTELNLIWPNRIIESKFDLQSSVNCEGERIAQLFSNILSNALTYSNEDEAVTVSAVSNEKEFILSVSNHCPKIPDSILRDLFKPFSRGNAKPGLNGLGLGLYISSEIARAHGGTLEVSSAEGLTCFTLTIENPVFK